MDAFQIQKKKMETTPKKVRKKAKINKLNKNLYQEKQILSKLQMYKIKLKKTTIKESI